MKILEAGLRHISHIAGLFDAYRQFYGQPSDIEGARRFLRDRIERAESTIFFATPDVNVPADTAGIVQLYPSFSSVRMRPIVILNDLFVTPEWRGREGVAMRLVVRAHDFARERRAAAVVLETAPDNARAQALYRRLNYQIDGMAHYAFTL